MSDTLDQAGGGGGTSSGGVQPFSQVDPVALEHTVRALLDVWREDTGDLSSSTEKAAHPAYQLIINLGQTLRAPVMTILLKELQRRPAHLFTALRAIAGENPVGIEARGNVSRMKAAWLEYGRAKGYLADVP